MHTTIGLAFLAFVLVCTTYCHLRAKPKPKSPQDPIDLELQQWRELSEAKLEQERLATLALHRSLGTSIPANVIDEWFESPLGCRYDHLEAHIARGKVDVSAVIAQYATTSFPAFDVSQIYTMQKRKTAMEMLEWVRENTTSANDWRARITDRNGIQQVEFRWAFADLEDAALFRLRWS